MMDDGLKNPEDNNMENLSSQKSPDSQQLSGDQPAENQTGQTNQQIPDNGEPPEGYFGRVNQSQQNWQNNPNGYGDPYSQMGRGVMNQYGRYDGFGGPAGNGTYAPQPKTRKEGGDGFALASMIFGIISICLFASFINFITAILALVFGIVYLTGYIVKHKGQAVSGIVMGVASVILCFVAWGTFISSPVMKGMMENTQQNPSSVNNLYQQVEDYQNGDITYQELVQNLMNGSSNSTNPGTDSESDSDGN